MIKIRMYLYEDAKLVDLRDLVDELNRITPTDDYFNFYEDLLYSKAFYTDSEDDCIDVMNKYPRVIKNYEIKHFCVAVKK